MSYSDIVNDLVKEYESLLELSKSLDDPAKQAFNQSMKETKNKIENITSSLKTEIKELMKKTTDLQEISSKLLNT